MTSDRDYNDWIRGEAGVVGQAQQHLEALRRSAWVVAVAVILCAGAALLYLSRAETVYEAHVDVLVSPAVDRDADLVGLSVLGTSADPTRSVETAARLMTAPEVARRVRKKLALRQSAASLRRSVQAVPVATSDVVTITARASEPDLARRLADGFAQGAVAERTVQLHAQLDELIPRVEARLAQTRDPAVRETLGARLADLQTLREIPDRTVRPATRAELPGTAVSPRPLLTIAVALIAGLLVGTGGVIARELLSPRVWREGQLRARFLLPVLARVPQLALAPRRILPTRRRTELTAFRGLRAALIARQDEGIGGRCVVVTSTTSTEGKSVVAVNLARSFAQAGKRVLLVEADPRGQSIATLQTGQNHRGVLEVLGGQVPLRDAVVTAPGESEDLSLLVMGENRDALPDVMGADAAVDFLRDAEELVDWVVIESPPADHLFDALPLTLAAQHVLVVVRLGTTKTSQLDVFAEALADNGVEPAGFVVLDARRERSNN